MFLSTRLPMVGILVLAGAAMVHGATEPDSGTNVNKYGDIASYKVGDWVRLTPQRAKNWSIKQKDNVCGKWEVEIVDTNVDDNTITIHHPGRASKFDTYEYTLITKHKRPKFVGQWKGFGLNESGIPVPGKAGKSSKNVRCVPARIPKKEKEAFQTSAKHVAASSSQFPFEVRSTIRLQRETHADARKENDLKEKQGDDDGYVYEGKITKVTRSDRGNRISVLTRNAKNQIVTVFGTPTTDGKRLMAHGDFDSARGMSKNYAGTKFHDHTFKIL